MHNDFYLPQWIDGKRITSGHFHVQERYYDQQLKILAQLAVHGNYGLLPIDDQPADYQIFERDGRLSLKIDRALVGISRDGTMYSLDNNTICPDIEISERQTREVYVGLEKIAGERRELESSLQNFPCCTPRYLLRLLEKQQDLVAFCQSGLLIGRLVYERGIWSQDGEYPPPCITIDGHRQMYRLWNEVYLGLYQLWQQSAERRFQGEDRLDEIVVQELCDLLPLYDTSTKVCLRQRLLLTELRERLLYKLQAIALKVHLYKLAGKRPSIFPSRAPQIASAPALRDLYLDLDDSEDNLKWPGTVPFRGELTKIAELLQQWRGAVEPGEVIIPTVGDEFPQSFEIMVDKQWATWELVMPTNSIPVPLQKFLVPHHQYRVACVKIVVPLVSDREYLLVVPKKLSGCIVLHDQRLLVGNDEQLMQAIATKGWQWPNDKHLLHALTPGEVAARHRSYSNTLTGRVYHRWTANSDFSNYRILLSGAAQAPLDDANLNGIRIAVKRESATKGTYQE